ncbi:dimethyladenosine transferase 2, mitochondrial [Trachemys scripta elegans]|uniref:dimethyladenosine transferase 2, mitochondrial n=1 Tax=Trachemys scripta elegans TaxID=31138 RepID=UPI0015564C0C|nr:dimethyladenosine transferase 2, mitochondrial [Trachemys scripta elegans]
MLGALLSPGLTGRRSVLAALGVAAAALRPLLCGLPGCRAPRRGLGQEPRQHPDSRLQLRLPEAAEAARLVLERARSSPPLRRFIACPDLARAVHASLECGPARGPEPVVLECEPGPGVLTRTLLNAGARVVALESDRAFLPDLQSLENSLHGQLEVVYCDFFRLDPLGCGSMKPPAMYSEKLFENLGILTVPWTADVPVKIIGFLPQKKERNTLWKLIFVMYERSSIYRYGRIELNMFVSEKEYKVLTAKPGELRSYQALSVLWQTACEIQLLHMEPWSSFLTNSKTRGLAIPKSTLLPNDHLCLVRMTPRRNLFTGGMTTTNSSTFILMVKQCLAKRKSKLIDRLNSWSPGSGSKLLRELEIPENIITGNLYPEEYRRLFEAMEHSKEFSQSWLYDEVLENNRNINF